jgi:predicted  nucleic acid-binding Zn-ribbon protein
VGLVNRLEAAEAALKAERASRNELEKSLAEAKARIRDLQTQLAHTELAHREVLAAMRAEGEAAQDLIRDLRAHLRAVEDAQQAAPDAKKIERVALREPRRPSALNGTPTVT